MIIDDYVLNGAAIDTDEGMDVVFPIRIRNAGTMDLILSTDIVGVRVD